MPLDDPPATPLMAESEEGLRERCVGLNCTGALTPA